MEQWNDVEAKIIYAFPNNPVFQHSIIPELLICFFVLGDVYFMFFQEFVELFPVILEPYEAGGP